MITSHGYAARKAGSPLSPFRFERRELRSRDVLIEVEYCGVCHSDIHQARDEWGGATFPMVPGHEVIGRVVKVGGQVSKFKIGDRAGVGCLVDSCRECEGCKDGFEQFCEGGFVGTYNDFERDGKTPTYGGYASNIVVDESFALRISPKLDPAATAPLLCAGITTYSPLRHWKVGPGKKMGVVGLGGLGHMAVKFGRSFGAHVTVFTTSPSKKEDALRLGAHDVVVTKNPDALTKRAKSLDFILNTVSVPHDLDAYLALLGRHGTMVLVGIPEKPLELQVFSLLSNRRSLAGSPIGGIAETQEMLDYCADHGIASDIEIIPMHKINEAYERTLKSDVKYRFVIDLKTLKPEA